MARNHSERRRGQNHPPVKVLNLYACLGGNRYKWDEVADIEVTAVELDPVAAELYAERFPNDTVIVADAHAYLLNNFQRFDFIWSSPPCPTHSRARFWRYGATGQKPSFPDMRLYEEIIFLQHHFKGKYVVENVIPYYEPLMHAQKRDRHLYWTNFPIPQKVSDRQKVDVCQGSEEMKRLCAYHDYDFTKYDGEQNRLKMARNLVYYEAGKRIFEAACGIIRKQDVHQLELL